MNQSGLSACHTLSSWLSLFTCYPIARPLAKQGHPPQVVDGQLVTKEERSFVDTVLLAGDPGAEDTSLADEAAALEPQRTIKINQLSFNENGEYAAEAARPGLNLL